VKLTIVGCSGSFAGPQSPASCYLLQARAGDGKLWSVLLDLGAGAFGALQKYVDPTELDAVFISHLDPDHCVDLAGLRVWRHYHPRDAQSSIPIYAPTAGETFIAQLAGAGEELAPSSVLEHRPWVAGTPTSVGPFTITVERVNHPVEAYGMRISGPATNGAGSATLCFSGDTDDCPELDLLAAHADLLLIEAGFTEARDDPRDIHLTGERAGAVAARNHVNRTVLTHIPPWNDPQEILAEAQRTHSGPIELATPGAVFTL